MTPPSSVTLCDPPHDYCTITPIDDAREIINKKSANHIPTTPVSLSNYSCGSSPFKIPKRKAEDLSPPTRLYERLDAIRLQLREADKRFKELTLQRQELLWLLEETPFAEQSALQQAMFRLYSKTDMISKVSLYNWSAFNYRNEPSGTRMFANQRKPNFEFNVNAVIDFERKHPILSTPN